MTKKFYMCIVWMLVIVAGLALVSCVGTDIMPGGKSKAAPAGEAYPPAAADKGAPYYFMSVATSNFQMPGGGQSGGGLGGFLAGKVMGAMTGPQRTLNLKLNSKPAPAGTPAAAHDTPAGSNLGRLPLVTPVHAATTSQKEEATPWQTPGQEEKPEPQKIKMYWGCTPIVPSGQPKVFDTAKMSSAQAMKMMSGRTITRLDQPSERPGWVYAEWPNAESSFDVPDNASLAGQQLVHGNYIPHLTFQLGPNYDFMAPVEFEPVTSGLDEAITLTWKSIPSAEGYFIMAVGNSDKTKETVIWTSSMVYEPGFGLLDYIPTSRVKRLIKESVVMGPDKTSCTIPKGVFAGMDAAFVQFIAYGSDYYAAYPPASKTPDWRVMGQYKSTGTLMLGQQAQAAPAAKPEKKEEQEEGGGLMQSIKGIFN